MADESQRAHLRERNRVFATILIAAIVAYLMALGVWNTSTLSSPDWCAEIVATEEETGEKSARVTDECIGLKNKQIDSLAMNTYINQGTLSLSVLVLVIIVIARGKVKVSASKDGVSADIGKHSSEEIKDEHSE